MDNVKEFLKESNAIEDVYGEDSLKQAERAWEYLVEQDKLTAFVIQKAHWYLMEHQLLEEKYKGHFRDVAVWIGGKKAIHYSLVPSFMEVWLEDVATSVLVPGKGGGNIKVDHVEFEKIHPFVDGNGRIGRMLMNWERVKVGLPILVIKESEKRDYYKWFK